MTPRPKFNLLRLPYLALDEVFKRISVLELIELSLTSTKTGILIYPILQKRKLQLDLFHGYNYNNINLLSGSRYSILQVQNHLDSARFYACAARCESSGMFPISYDGCFLYSIVRRQTATIKNVLSILFKFITSFRLSGRIVNDNMNLIQELLLTSNRKFPISFESRDVTHYRNPLVYFPNMLQQMKSLRISQLPSKDIRYFLEAWVNKKLALEEVSIKSGKALKSKLVIFGIEGVSEAPFEKVIKGKVVKKCYEIRREDGVKAIVYVDGDTFNLVNVNCLD